MSSITIGNNKINFPKETTISHIEVFRNFIVFSTWPIESDLDDSKIETHQIWRDRCINNPSELFCYDLSGELKWKFPEKNIVGFGKIDLGALKEEDFITSGHYKSYIEKFKGKELLEVYAGNHRYLLDANTGDIYDKIVSR
jgi:hypothetical protein